MGYKWRKTTGAIGCKPKEFNSLIYPEPNRTCNKNCLYFIFCELEINHVTLGQRVNEIRLILQRPFHIFTYLPKEKMVMLVLEGENLEEFPRLTFTGNDIMGAVQSAETYIEHESQIGSLRPKEKEKKK